MFFLDKHFSLRQSAALHMKRDSAVLPALLLIFFLSGCAAPRTLAPVPVAGQSLTYTQGTPTLISRRKNAALVALLTPQTNGNAIFFVGVANRSKQPFNFGSENIAADSNGRPLQVFSYEDLARQVQSKQAWSNVAIALGAGARAAAAAQPSRTYAQGNIYGYNGQQIGSYNAYGTTYDPIAQQAAQSAITAEAQGQSAENAARAQAQLAQLSAVLRTTTVYPGKTFGGVAEINTNGALGALAVTLNVGGEPHVFTFRISP